MKISVEAAAQQLKEGHVVAVPTETVYGLAASITCPEAIKSIFTLKGRPSSNPLIIHVADIQAIQSYICEQPEGFQALTRAFWPGPMTIVLPIHPDRVPAIVRADLPTAAFRIPSHRITQQLLKLTFPLVMPSANRSGSPSATTAAHVESDFGSNFPVLEGSCSVGVESTILIYDKAWQIIRQGALPPAAFEPILGYVPKIKGVENQEKPLCPGQLFRHYAPKAKLTLTTDFQGIAGQVIVGYTDRIYPPSNHLIPLGNSSSPEEIAENLYKILRLLDERGIQEAYVDVLLPPSGLFATILERLFKAAQK